MKQNDLIRYLESFAASQIKDLGKMVASGYLKRCIEHWRQHYGEQVADEMERRTKALWQKNAPEQAQRG